MRKLLIFVTLLALLAVAAMPTLAQEEDTAHVRVAHFATDAAAVDVYVNGEMSEMDGDFEFGDVTEWMEVPAGSYDFAVAPAGTSLEDAVAELSADLEAGDWVTVAAIGLVGNDTVALQPIVEDFEELELGISRITLFHAIPSAPAVDVYLSNDEGEVQLVRGLTFPGMALQQVGVDTPEANDGTYIADYDSGVYNIVVTELDNADNVIFEIEDAELNQFNNYLIAAVGLANDPDVVVVSTSVNDMGSEGTTTDMSTMECEGDGTVMVRVAHFAHLARTDETSNVDIYLNGEATGTTVDFGDISDFMEVESGNYDVAVVPAGGALDDAELVVEGAPICSESGWLTVAAIGYAENDSLMLQPIYEDYSELGLNRSRVTVFHAVGSGPAIDVLANDEALIDRLSYPGSIPGAEASANDGVAIRDLDSGEYTFDVVLSDDATTELTSITETLDNGQNVFIAIIGTPGNVDYSVAITDVP